MKTALPVNGAIGAMAAATGAEDVAIAEVVETAVDSVVDAATVGIVEDVATINSSQSRELQSSRLRKQTAVFLL